MTDSQAGPGAPSSLKFAALSVQSYQLDSPPFTGAAVGGSGPLDEAGQRIPHRSSNASASSSYDNEAISRSKSAFKKASTSPLAKSTSIRTPSEDRDPYVRSMSQTRAMTDRDGSAPESAQHASDSPVSNSQNNHDHDVPPWDLDNNGSNSRFSSRAHSSASLATLSPSKTVLGFTTPQQTDSHSSLHPSFEKSATQRQPQPPHSSEDRPSYSQFAEEQDSQEDAGSSAADVDDEVDGDERLSYSNGSRSRDLRVPRQGQTLEEYRFPRHRLPTRLRDESKVPLVIVACGSFSPPTYLHLRIFEMAKDQVNESGRYELMAGYYSPVSDYYKKEGLAKATHRVRMCELAVEKTSTWLMVDAWESLQNEYQRTAVVLDHFNEEINGGSNGGVQLSDGSRRDVKIMLLAGGDLIQSMGEPGVWATADVSDLVLTLAAMSILM